jgi:hypothetical protein
LGGRIIGVHPRLSPAKKSCFGQSITNGRRVRASNAIALGEADTVEDQVTIFDYGRGPGPASVAATAQQLGSYGRAAEQQNLSQA